MDAGAREACFIAPELFSVPWRAGRERTPRPFRRFLIYRSEKFLRFLTRRAREGTSTVLRLIFVSLFTLCLQKSNALPAVRSACCLIARRKFSADLKNIFGFLHSDGQHSHNSPGAEAPRLKTSSFAITRQKRDSFVSFSMPSARGRCAFAHPGQFGP